MHRIVAFVNGRLGAEALSLVAGDLAGVVLHEPARRRDGAMLAASIPPGTPVFSSADDLPRRIGSLRPTHGLAVLYGYRLPPAVLECFPGGVANLHLSLLPWGRGAHPNAWGLAEGHPAGVTLHLMDAGIDSGPVLAGRRVEVEPEDTAASLYDRLTAAGRAMLAAELPCWVRGELTPRPQDPAPGPLRRAADLDRVLRVDPDRTYRGRELIDLLRARSFPPHPGAPYECDGRRLRIRIEIEEERT